VGCVGGTILPRFETKEPAWAKYPNFLYVLSILDRGDEIVKVNDAQIYGCNYSIRKTVLYDAGGFHPDSTPPSLMRYLGDGGVGLTNKAIERDYDVVYTPYAVVTHVIPQEKVTRDYFKRRAFIQGVCDSYIEIRKNGSVAPTESSLTDSVKSAFGHWLA